MTKAGGIKIRFLIVLTFVLVFLFFQCTPKNKSSVPEAALTTENFYFLKNYIRANGKHDRVDISGKKGGGMWVDYYTIEDGKWKITVDHSIRIYFSINDERDGHFGNILLEDDTVKTEFNYGVPEKSKEMLEEERKNRVILLKEFSNLVGEAREKYQEKD